MAGSGSVLEGLQPDLWFSYATPDLSDLGLWGEDFPALQQHLRQSPFWNHWDRLRSDAQTLSEEYDKVVGRVPRQDEQFWAAWDTLQNLRWLTARPNRTPTFGLDEADDSISERAATDLHAMNRRILSRLMSLLPNLPQRVFELETALAQLRADLRPDVIEPMIATSKGDVCRLW